MRFFRFGPALLVLAIWAAPAGAVDLSKIDRTIAKEPAYQGKPKYCLLVFGPEAKTRVWLVMAGDTLYVDRNGNGYLTEPDKQVQRKNGYSDFDLGPITAPDGTTKPSGVRINPGSYGVMMEREVEGSCRLYVGYDPSDCLAFADRPKDAPVVHFDGPLTFRWYGKPPVLVPGQTCRFHTALGTPGLGKGSFAAVAPCSVPGGTKLTALIEYPHQAAGENPILEEIGLGRD